ncbi:MAG: hypothetical protein ACI97N_001789 [Cognaticolwellia sp.]|jgi:hypothetical protein
MLNFVLSLRIKQFFRGLTEIGFIRVVIIIPFMAIIILGLMESLLSRSLWEAFGFLALMLISLHFNRKDKHFLSVLKNQRDAVFAIEYLMVSLPFIIWFIIENAWLQVISTIILLRIIPLLKWTFVYTNSTAWLRFPKLMTKDFEWMLGIRKNIGYIILIYILAIILSYFTVSVLVALILLAIITATFYLEKSEPRNYLHLYADSPSELMRQKALRAVGLYLLSTIPLSIAFLVFHFQYWYLLLAALAISSIIQLTSVTLKYVTFTPKESNQRNVILLGFLVACWFTPFLQPVPLLMTMTYYRKAKNRLKLFY